MAPRRASRLLGAAVLGRALEPLEECGTVGLQRTTSAVPALLRGAQSRTGACELGLEVRRSASQLAAALGRSEAPKRRQEQRSARKKERAAAKAKRGGGAKGGAKNKKKAKRQALGPE